jgi:drug/metabolite transporter (DMT)-like permease
MIDLRLQRYAFAALAAAALFGVSTPIAKRLLGEVSPVVLAGLLYLGSGVGLGLWLLARRVSGRGGFSRAEAPLARADLPWIAGAVLAGGVAAPVVLLWGLAGTPASEAALLLNFESVLTAAVAAALFREAVGRRVWTAAAVMLVAGVLLAYDPRATLAISPRALAIVGACALWALDNNLTRKVSLADADYHAMVKGLVAGTTNAAFALAAGSKLPAPGTVLGAGIIGFLGYGVSLALFVFALRQLGTARTGAYFSTAPFAGAIIAMALLREPLTTTLAIAAVLMAAGVWLHVSERHEHRHTHDLLEHTHEHGHDVHHQHAHGEPVAPGTRHTHRHRHEALTHSHPHYPDAHHRHGHHSCAASVLERDGSPSG